MQGGGRSEVCLYKLFRRNSLIFMEGFDEIAFVVEAAGYGGFFDADILCGEHFAGALNAVIVQIIDGGALCHAAEIAAEIFGIHARHFRKLPRLIFLS